MNIENRTGFSKLGRHAMLWKMTKSAGMLAALLCMCSTPLLAQSNEPVAAPPAATSVVVLPPTAAAPTDAPLPVEPAAASAEAGMFLPYTHAPRVDTQRAFVRAIGGMDFARNSAILEGNADITLFGPVAVRVGAVYTQRPNNLRPTAGLRLAALNQDSHGLDLSVGAYYRPEGFTEMEGEVEFVVAVARRFGRLTTFANLIYGQDPEGRERDGELRMAALYACNRVLHAGIDGRLRFDMGEEAEGVRRAGEAEYDLAIGPTLSHAFGNVAAIGQLGVSAVGQEKALFGWLALLGFAGTI